MDASKGLVETTFGMYPRVQFVHESLRTHFLGEGVVHLTCQAIADSTRGSHPRETQAEQTQAMAGCCHNQLKEHCLGCLMEIIPFRLHDQRSRLGEYSSTSYPFCKYAIYGVTSHAESALDCGQHQEDFKIAVPWSWLGVLHEIANYENVGWQEGTDTAPWYKAYVVAKLGHTKLLKAVLETLSPSEVVPWQWGAIICASTEISDSDGVSATLQAGADPRKPTSSEYRSCLRYAVEHACRNEQGGNSLHTQGWDIVELLVKHGVRSYATCDGDADCIYEACRDHDVEIFESCSESDSGQIPHAQSTVFRLLVLWAEQTTMETTRSSSYSWTRVLRLICSLAQNSKPNGTLTFSRSHSET
jgi:hypothetical protein